MTVAIKIENLSKQYRLGQVSTRTLSHDLNRWWQTTIRGKEDPYLKIGEVNDRATRGDSEYVWALHDINLEVEQGEVLGIIGKNGAGKSTLLKILSKVTAPTTGTIKTKGRIASLLEVGTGFHYEMTGRENIFMNGALLGMTKAEIYSRFDEIVDFAGVERYIDTPVKRYSSGMLVRLGFAVAAHLEPEILVVDEVLAVGDTEFQKKAIGKMQDISKGYGRTVLFVSHNMLAIEDLCYSSVLLEQGIVCCAGPTHKVIKQYQNKKNIENKISIADRKDRNGNGSFRIIEFQVKNENESEVIESFDRIKFTIRLNKKIEKNSIVRIEIGAYELTNNPLFRIDTGNAHIEGKGQTNKFSIITSELNLVSTTCSFNVALFINNELSDHIVDAKKIEIFEKSIKGITFQMRNHATILISSLLKFE